MIIMPVPKDIRTVRAKFIGPFTKRQTYAVCIAGAVTITIFMTVGKLLSSEVLSVVLGILNVPILLCGFVDVYGMPLWVYAKDVAIGKFLAPKSRPYETDNTYAGYAKQNRITYEYFDGDEEVHSAREQKKIMKKNQKRLEKFLKENPNLKPID